MRRIIQCFKDYSPHLLYYKSVSEGAVEKFHARQRAPEHGRQPFSLMVTAASPMPFHKAMVVVGVPGRIAHRRVAVNGCQWLVHSHPLTAYLRRQGRPPRLSPLSNEK